MKREKDIEQAVIRALRAMGYHVTKTSQHAKPQGMTEGIPDLFAMGHGHSLWIEVKSPRGRLRPSQAAWHERAAREGVAVVVARSAADLLEPLRALGAPIE